MFYSCLYLCLGPQEGMHRNWLIDWKPFCFLTFKSKKSYHCWCLSWHIPTFGRKQWGVEKPLSDNHNHWRQNESIISFRWFVWQTRTQCFESMACSCDGYTGSESCPGEGERSKHQARTWFVRSDALVKKKLLLACSCQDDLYAEVGLGSLSFLASWRTESSLPEGITG